RDATSSPENDKIVLWIGKFAAAPQRTPHRSIALAAWRYSPRSAKPYLSCIAAEATIRPISGFSRARISLPVLKCGSVQLLLLMSLAGLLLLLPQGFEADPAVMLPHNRIDDIPPQFFEAA